MDAVLVSVSSSYPQTALSLNTGHVAERLLHTDEIKDLSVKRIWSIVCAVGCCSSDLRNPQIGKAAPLQQPATHRKHWSCVCKRIRPDLCAVWWGGALLSVLPSVAPVHCPGDHIFCSANPCYAPCRTLLSSLPTPVLCRADFPSAALLASVHNPTNCWLSSALLTSHPLPLTPFFTAPQHQIG